MEPVAEVDERERRSSLGERPPAAPESYAVSAGPPAEVRMDGTAGTRGPGRRSRCVILLAAMDSLNASCFDPRSTRGIALLTLFVFREWNQGRRRSPPRCPACFLRPRVAEESNGGASVIRASICSAAWGAAAPSREGRGLRLQKTPTTERRSGDGARFRCVHGAPRVPA